jgi:hypothetical protein
MTVDEAKALIAESEGPPTVRWIDKGSRWHYGRLTSVGRKWATIETGGGDLPKSTHKVDVERLRERRKA